MYVFIINNIVKLFRLFHIIQLKLYLKKKYFIQSYYYYFTIVKLFSNYFTHKSVSINKIVLLYWKESPMIKKK